MKDVLEHPWLDDKLVEADIMVSTETVPSEGSHNASEAYDACRSYIPPSPRPLKKARLLITNADQVTVGTATTTPSSLSEGLQSPYSIKLSQKRKWGDMQPL